MKKTLLAVVPLLLGLALAFLLGGCSGPPYEIRYAVSGSGMHTGVSIYYFDESGASISISSPPVSGTTGGAGGCRFIAVISMPCKIMCGICGNRDTTINFKGVCHRCHGCHACRNTVEFVRFQNIRYRLGHLSILGIIVS